MKKAIALLCCSATLLFGCSGSNDENTGDNLITDSITNAIEEEVESTAIDEAVDEVENSAKALDSLLNDL